MDRLEQERLERGLRDLRAAFIDTTLHAQDAFAVVREVARLRIRVAELEAALRGFLSMPAHRYQGDCPGPGYPALRDPDCPACQVMVRAAALLSGKERS